MSPDLCMDHFIASVYRLYFHNFPLQQSTRKKCSPWITNKFKYCIKKKSKLLKLYCRGTIPKSHYRKYCNILTATIRKAKRQYYNLSFLKSKGDQIKTWRLINKLKNKCNSAEIDAETRTGRP